MCDRILFCLRRAIIKIKGDNHQHTQVLIYYLIFYVSFCLDGSGSYLSPVAYKMPADLHSCVVNGCVDTFRRNKKLLIVTRFSVCQLLKYIKLFKLLKCIKTKTVTVDSSTCFHWNVVVVSQSGTKNVKKLCNVQCRPYSLCHSLADTHTDTHTEDVLQKFSCFFFLDDWV